MYRQVDVTLETLLALADARLGSRKAVLKAMPVSRQRLYSALRGGPPLHAERLLRLAIAAGVDPSAALRAGGRARFADLLERAYRSEEARRAQPTDITPTERVLLQEFERLHEDTKQIVLHLVADLAVKQRARRRTPRRRPVNKSDAT